MEQIHTGEGTAIITSGADRVPPVVRHRHLPRTTAQPVSDDTRRAGHGRFPARGIYGDSLT